MNKKKYLAGALAALMMVGCTDELDENTGGGSGELTGETGYIKVALNLPSTSGNSFRAADANGNDDFNDGIEAEYKVNNVILALFYGSSETEATLKYACSLVGNWTNDVDNDNVTKYFASVQAIPSPGEEENVYALAIVNNGGYFGVDATTNRLTMKSSSEGTLTDVGENFTLASFYSSTNVMTSDMSAMANTASNKGNFLMLNAPISNMPSFAKGSNTGHAVTTLVPLNVYASESAANQDANIDEIYVERAVAKVTVTGSSSVSIDNDGTSYDGMKVTFDGWVLQNTNKKMYAVRNVYSSNASTAIPSDSKAWETWDVFYVGSETNRFYGTTANPYRVYWGVDPNYFTKIESTSTIPDGLADNFNIWTSDSAPDQWLTVDTNTSDTDIEAGYCAENTTVAADDNDDEVMLDNQLTSVLIKATLGDGEDVFLCGSDLSLLYTKEMFLQAATAALANSSTEGVPLEDGKKLALISLDEGMIIDGNDEEENKKTVADLLEIVEDGASSTSDDTVLTDDQQLAILTAFGNKISYYQDGVTYYYTSLIEHFGDNPTVYNGDPNEVEYNNNDHLGRYGVLRNNWYELNITNVTGPGEPEIPTIPEDPADEKEKWIKTQINILSWAKRTQNVEL